LVAQIEKDGGSHVLQVPSRAWAEEMQRGRRVHHVVNLRIDTVPLGADAVLLAVSGKAGGVLKLQNARLLCVRGDVARLSGQRLAVRIFADAARKNLPQRVRELFGVDG